MKYGTKDIDWAEVVAMLAHTSDGEQFEFLSSFCKELRTACATSHNVGMQMAYVQDKLSKEDREMLAALGPDRG